MGRTYCVCGRVGDHECPYDEIDCLNTKVTTLEAENAALRYDAETALLIEEHHLSTGPAGDGSRSAAWKKGAGKIHNADTLGEAVRAAVEAGR